jgi:outer membrane protein OmpA-like peptidoglycan-associated protein
VAKAAGEAMIIIEKTTVTVWGQISYDPVVDPYYGTIQTGTKYIQNGDPKNGVEIRYFDYNGPGPYGYNLTITKETIQIKPPPPFFRPYMFTPPDLTTFGDGLTARTINIKRLNSKIDVKFKGNSDEIDPASLDEAMNQIRPLAGTLARNPGLRLILTGNGGFDNLLNEPVKINGPASTAAGTATYNGNNNSSQSALYRGRAEAIKNILVNTFGIDPSRITTKAGVIYNDPSGRFVESVLQ